MIPRLSVAGLLALMCVSPDIAAADGALAIGVTSPITEGGLAYGFTRHFAPRNAAQAAALDTCRKTANVPQTAANCRIVGMFTDQCFAIAFIPESGSGFGWAIDPDRPTAERKAMDDCAAMAGKDDKRCRIIQARCDGSTLADRCGGHGGESPAQRVDSCTALIRSGDESDRDLVSDYVNRGNAHADNQQLDDAIADYGEALARNPAHAVAFYDRGTAYRLKRDYDKAIADYDRAIMLDPRYEDAFVNRGAAYAAKGDLDRAITEYTTALMLDVADSVAYRNRGDAYVDKGDMNLAMDDYNEAIRRAPGDGGGYRSRGYLRFYLGDFAAAADDLVHVVRWEPDDAYAPLWAYLATARANAENARRYLELAAARPSPAWPRPVVELFLGTRTVEATLSAASNPAERCEALFYGGEWKLLQSDQAGAVTALKEAGEICPKTFIEHKGAQAEMKRLGR